MIDKRMRFPVLNDTVIEFIPWDALAPHEDQAQKNHSQSLKKLASRGGLSIEELFYVLTDRSYSTTHVPKNTKRDAAFRLEIMKLLYKHEIEQQSHSAQSIAMTATDLSA